MRVSALATTQALTVHETPARAWLPKESGFGIPVVSWIIQAIVPEKHRLTLMPVCQV